MLAFKLTSHRVLPTSTQLQVTSFSSLSACNDVTINFLNCTRKRSANFRERHERQETEHTVNYFRPCARLLRWYRVETAIGE